VANWRDELIEAVKTKVEREAEDAEKQRLRVREALTSAEAALKLGADALGFAVERVKEKGQEASLDVAVHAVKLVLGNLSLAADLDPTTAIIKVTYLDAKAREFDFARDRHITAADVEEYLGRRVVELVRAAQKANPW
jgi:hypothetical protein